MRSIGLNPDRARPTGGPYSIGPPRPHDPIRRIPARSPFWVLAHQCRSITLHSPAWTKVRTGDSPWVCPSGRPVRCLLQNARAYRSGNLGRMQTNEIGFVLCGSHLRIRGYVKFTDFARRAYGPSVGLSLRVQFMIMGKLLPPNGRSGS